MISELAWSPNGRYLASTSAFQNLIWETVSRSVIARLSYPGDDVCGLQWSPSRNMLAFTALDGKFVRWSNPVPKTYASPTATEQQEKRRVDRLLDDDDARGADVDMEERGEDLGDEDGDEADWIVDDEGDYGVDDSKWGKGRTEVGESESERSVEAPRVSPPTVQSTSPKRNPHSLPAAQPTRTRNDTSVSIASRRLRLVRLDVS